MIYLGTERIFANVWGKKQERKKSTKDYDEKLWKWGKEAIFWKYWCLVYISMRNWTLILEPVYRYSLILFVVL